ncbi:ferritin heavy chain A-like [Tachyglossus aculeatus]|uniref:ferritin heavy chain A-like n=1 Tax=Tachyglossus aculeatus TaxID=9261 RepID=UPI0018F6FB2D|nr:ferritin heavy chain A-like [Tachyglossus aculeatus]
MCSQVCQNFHVDCEIAIGQVVTMELHASYIYLSMACHFERYDMALGHFAKFFKKQSHEERDHAEKFLKYLNKRGGHILLQEVKKPVVNEWQNGLEVLEAALKLEKKVNQGLLALHRLASERSDPHLCDFLEREYLDQQVKTIKLLGNHITNLKQLGTPKSGLGGYLFDKLTLGENN